MSQDTASAADPRTDADAEALDRALASGRSAAEPGREESTSASQPARGPAPAHPDGGTAVRRQPDSE
ncbi:hypothetical protein AB0953_14785 [Streptomyces sp. NPDC046866]|uniref:hypothetical protein n=1 Tax=Streptomyces sp. NPDC046866 TaxID=3154921 RepID=UPI00345154CF